MNRRIIYIAVLASLLTKGVYLNNFYSQKQEKDTTVVNTIDGKIEEEAKDIFDHCYLDADKINEYRKSVVSDERAFNDLLFGIIGYFEMHHDKTSIEHFKKVLTIDKENKFAKYFIRRLGGEK